MQLKAVLKLQAGCQVPELQVYLPEMELDAEQQTLAEVERQLDCLIRMLKEKQLGSAEHSWLAKFG